MKSLLALLVLFSLSTSAWSQTSTRTIDPQRITILRDSFGVAHIHAPTDAEVAYGFAWAQAEDDFKTIQLTLLPLRGRLAAYSGKSGAILDVAAAMLGVDTLVDQRYTQDLSPAFRELIEAYAAGLNDYAAKHPQELLLKGLLPFTGKDIIKGYVFETAFLTGVQGPLADIFDNRLPEVTPAIPTGSNAFAISPSITEDGHTYFCSNSHQPLQGPYSWYEAHLVSDEGWNFLGATFPGGITPFVGTNPYLGWSHTVNHPDLADVYELQMHPNNPLQYRFDEEWKTLESFRVKLRVKIGPVRIPLSRKYYRSVYGLTLRNRQGFYALRFPANQDIRAAEQWYRMNKATDWTSFQEALRMNAIPGTNIVYADREGHIYYVGNAKFPRRSSRYDWSGVVPGNTSETLWTTFVPFDSLAQVLDPACGYVFNTNHSPFFSTAPADAPSIASLPHGHGYLQSHNNRSLRFLELLQDQGIGEIRERVVEGSIENDSPGILNWEDFVRIKYDLHYSDTLPDPVIVNWHSLLEIDPSTHPDLAPALQVLRDWDRSTHHTSKGATLFLLSWHFMYQALAPEGRWKRGYRASEEELATALRLGVGYLQKHFGQLAVPLGELQRHRRGNVDLPVSGGPEILAAIYAVPGKDGRFESMVGDGFIQFVKYGPEGPVVLETVMPYGASSKPESPHFTDQMEMYVSQKRKTMTLVWEELERSALQSYHPNE